MNDPTESDRCPILTGCAWAFGLELPADCIVPLEEAGAEPLGALLMTPIDPEFPSRLQQGDVLVAGHFGAGTRDERPARAIREAGVAAIVATTFDDTFAQHSLAVGVPVIEIYEAMALHTGETLRVDLEGARVVNLSSGNRYPIRNLDEEVLETYRRRLAEEA